MEEIIALIKKNYDYVFGFIMNNVKNKDDAEDIYSNSVLRILSYDKFINLLTFRSWMCSVAKLEILRFYSANKKQRELTHDKPSNEQYEISDNEKRMSMILSVLPVSQKNIVYDHIGCGMTGEEVAKKYNLKSGRVIANRYKRVVFSKIKQLWAIFDISPNIQKINLLSLPEAGKILGIHAFSVLKKVKNKELQAIKLNKRYYIDISWLPKIIKT